MDQVEGVDLAALFNRLPKTRAATGDDAPAPGSRPGPPATAAQTGDAGTLSGVTRAARLQRAQEAMGPLGSGCPRSGRFWLLELRVSRTFLDNLRPICSDHGYPARRGVEITRRTKAFLQGSLLDGVALCKTVRKCSLMNDVEALVEKTLKSRALLRRKIHWNSGPRRGKPRGLFCSRT